VRPHRRQPTRLPHPWDSPGKNTGACCHFLLQCMKVKSESEVAQSWPTLCDPMNYSLPGSSVHGIFQARVLEWGANKLNKQDNIQPCYTLFAILTRSVVPHLLLNIVSWPAYRFLRSQVRWSGIPISWRIFQFVVMNPFKGFSVVNKAEVNVLFCFVLFLSRDLMDFLALCRKILPTLP